MLIQTAANYLALAEAAVSCLSTAWMAMNSGGGLAMKEFEAEFVNSLYLAITAGNCPGLEPSPEKPRTSAGAIAFAAGPAVDRAASIAAVEADCVGPALSTA